ncbi:MAG: PilC/PilY family type IV pilus protein [Myxococcota bacterium]
MTRSDRRWIPTVLGGLALAAAGVGGPAWAGDEDIFSAQIAPNVVLMVDNSGSMNSIMQHPAFVEVGFTPTCTVLTSSQTSATVKDQLNQNVSRVCGSGECRFEVSPGDAGWVATADTTDHPKNGYITRRFCGRDRKLYTDGVNFQSYGNKTWYEQDYTNWLYSLDTSSSTPVGPTGAQMTPTAILADIDLTNNGRNYVTGVTYPKYQIARITAAREIATDVIYQTNTDCPAYLGDCGIYQDRVRFGIAKFTTGANGGYLASTVDAYSTNRTALNTAINNLDAETSTPLGETLFKIYTFFMSRTSTNRPFGVNGSTRFPGYTYKMADGLNTSTTSLVAPDPIQQACQKNFVIMITDGEPTNDTFTTSGSETNGFGSYASLVGDYAPDAVGALDIGTDATPEVGTPPWGDATGAGWLDDIAKFMHDKDFRLDLAGNQTIDVYTVGFTTQGAANALLAHTAANGNGLFFTGNQSEALTDALVDSLQDIISKSQGFSAATVPAARTADGGQLYTTLFQPTSTRPFWPGLLRSYKITASGEVRDKNGSCALENLTNPSKCVGGTFKDEAAAEPYWNASKMMPGANARKLRISLTNGSSQNVVQFTHAIEAADLGGSLGAITLYPPVASVASTSDLDEAIVSFLAGCRWGTGMSAAGSVEFNGCVDRTQVVNGITQPDRLGDIFHSNPVVVGPPNAFLQEASYLQFAALSNLVHRNRIIMAGANDGFFHGFLAGQWQTTPAPAHYDVGTGVEVFGFMPWGARAKVMNLTKKDATGHPITVDGSPSVGDVWIDSDSDPTNAKQSSEWKTVMVTGLREGGEHYLALDVTDPAASGYPAYMWEFPKENDSTWRPLIAQTWSQPVITRVRLEDTSGHLVEKWVAVFGFGYDPTSNPNVATYSASSKKGRGIMMLDIATGTPIAVRKFGNSTGDVPEMLYSIASSPGVLDYDQDGFADLIYIGDLGGNIWKWVVRKRGKANPTSSELYQANWSFRKFFTDDPTRAASGVHTRSFFYAPSATIVNSILYLGLGTGERADLNCSSTLRGCNLLNRFYVIRDRDIWDLASPTVIDGRDYPTGQLTNVTADENKCPTVQRNGFSFSVADGEKFVTNSEIFNAFFFTSTFKPDLSNVCAPSGTSKLYGFLAKCGQGFFGPPSPVSPIAGTDRSMDMGKGMPTDARLSIAPGSGGNRLIISKQDGQLINVDSGSADSEHGTLYWRELD